MIKKICLFLTMMLFLPTLLQADRLDDIKNSGVLNAGVKYDFEPFGYIDGYGDVVGFDIDLARYIANYMGVELQMQQVTSENRISMVEDGSVDIAIASMTHTKKREQIIDFSMAYFFDGQSVLTRSNIMNTRVRGFSGKIVGAIEGSVSGKNFKSQVPKARIVYFDSYPNALESLKKGKIDAMTTDLVWCSVQAKNSNGRLKIIGEKFTIEPYGIGVQKGQSRLLEAINEAIYSAVDDGTYLELYEKWFETTPEMMPQPFEGI